MTRSLKTLRLIGLLASSVVFGLTLSHVLESPGNRALDGAAWLSVQHTFYGGFAIVGGVAEVIGFAATTTDAVISPSPASRRACTGLSRAVPARHILSYFFGNRPVNTKVAGSTAETLPADWSSYRDTWETAHAVSAILSAFALLVFSSRRSGRPQPTRRNRKPQRRRAGRKRCRAPTRWRHTRQSS
jgi:hypothetical protein